MAEGGPFKYVWQCMKCINNNKMWVLLEDRQLCAENFYDFAGKLIDYTRNITACKSFPKHHEESAIQEDYTGTVIIAISTVGALLMVGIMMLIGLWIYFRPRRGGARVTPVHRATPRFIHRIPTEDCVMLNEDEPEQELDVLSICNNLNDQA